MYAVLAVSLALVCYTAAVSYDLLKKRVSGLSLTLLGTGVAFDLLGTLLMSLIFEGFTVDPHTIIGFAALLLMITLAVWSYREYRVRLFSRKRRMFAFFALIVWLAVFLLGATGH